MAFKTRKIHIKGLNDAKYIAAIVYASTLAKIAIIIITSTLRSHVNTYPAVLNAVYILLETIILTLVFIPKVSENMVDWYCYDMMHTSNYYR